MIIIIYMYGKVEDLRHKLHSSNEENKRLQRVLIKELGDGSTLEQVTCLFI